MAGRIVSIKDSSVELRTAVLATKQFGKDLRREVNAWTRQEFDAVWKREVASAVFGAGAPMHVMNQGVRMKAGNPPQFQAGGIKRQVSGKRSGGGLRPYLHWPGFEYGANPHETVYTRKSKLGKVHTVKRDASRHLPKRTKNGRAYGPAAAAFIPRVISGWSQYVIRAFMEALEGRK